MKQTPSTTNGWIPQFIWDWHNYEWNGPPQSQMAGFRNSFGTGIAPVKKNAVKAFLWISYRKIKVQRPKMPHFKGFAMINLLLLFLSLVELESVIVATTPYFGHTAPLTYSLWKKLYTNQKMTVKSLDIRLHLSL